MGYRTMEERRESIAKLVGTTWERDGKRREIVRVDGDGVYWRTPGGAVRKQPSFWGTFEEWLIKAKPAAV